MLGLARVEQLNLGISAGAVAASYALATPQFAISLAAGAFLEALNLGAIHRGALKLFGGELEGARTWIGVFSLRFILLAVAIYWTLQVGANPAGLLIGLSLAMPATVIDAWINRPAVVDPSTLPVLLEDEADAEAWEAWSVWRPGRLITTQRDDLLSDASIDASFQTAQTAQTADAASDPASDESRDAAERREAIDLPSDLPSDPSDERASS